MSSVPPDELADRAARALTSGQPARALAIADQMTALEPENALARVIRAHALLSMGSFNEAYRESQIAALLDPKSDDAQMALALAAWRLRRLALAEQAFEAAMTLSGQNPQFKAQYAWFLASERAPRSALRAAEQVIERTPRSSVAWAALGLAQFRLQQADKAEESLRRAIDIDSQSPEARSAMIRVLKRRGAAKEAEALRESLRGAAPSHVFLDEDLNENASEAEFDEDRASQPPVVDLVRVRKWPAWIRPAAALIAIVGLFLVLLPRHPLMALASFLLATALAYATRGRWMTSDNQ